MIIGVYFGSKDIKKRTSGQADRLGMTFHYDPHDFQVQAEEVKYLQDDIVPPKKSCLCRHRRVEFILVYAV